VVNGRLRQASTDEDRRDARAGPEQVVDAGCARAGRRDVVPLPTELVVRHQDQVVAGLRPGLERLDQVDEMSSSLVSVP
jgi:hypothetical protein